MAKRGKNSGSLRDLVIKGKLEPGEELTCEPRKGEVYKATLEADGRISYQGEYFTSPSLWASEVARNSRNGWRDVHARDWPLDHFRNLLDPESISRSAARPKEQVGMGTASPPFFTLQIKNPTSEPPSSSETVDDMKKQLITRLLKLKPEEFERLVGKFLESIGVSDVQVTGRSHDGGIDGYGQIQPFGLRVAFQAKRWTSSVGAEPIRSLIGAVVINGYDRGVLITTSSFTPGAKEEADRPTSRVVLFDGDTIVDLMRARQLGVKKEPVYKEEVDENFFNSLGA